MSKYFALVKNYYEIIYIVSLSNLKKLPLNLVVCTLIS